MTWAKARAAVRQADTGERSRVVLLGLDGFPYRAITPERTPNLWALARSGGRAPDGGVAALPSSTYPGFASLLTGSLPATHGVLTTSFGAGAVPGWAGGRRVRVPTILHLARAAAVPIAVVLGDHLLHEVLDVASLEQTAAESSGDVASWPGGGRLTPGIALDAHGYATNEVVESRLLAAIRSPARLVFGHLNEADTLGHDLGPEAEATVACQRATDATVGGVVEELCAAGEWDRALVLVISDHDMEARAPLPAIDLLAGLGSLGLDGLVADVLPDGGAALVRPSPGLDVNALERLAGAIGSLDGVALCRIEPAGHLLAGAEVGRRFGPVGELAPCGGHGGPATERTVAIVGGGHPAVEPIAASIEARPPHLADWAPTIAALLGIRSAQFDGRSLLPTSSLAAALKGHATTVDA